MPGSNTTVFTVIKYAITCPYPDNIEYDGNLLHAKKAVVCLE